ncbi:response regulator [Candidatus Poribacteria bacterium]|nr:response regulator [Candidatus Poribacteria bacterium]
MDTDQSNDKKARILIGDDVLANRNLLRQTLAPEGYALSLVPCGEVALSLVREDQPDLILLDIIMPEGIDGFETCRRLKADVSTQNIPVIFITAKDETRSIVQGFGVGGVDYITKPFSEAEVRIRVQTHLKNARLTQQLREKNEALQREIERREQAERSQEHAEDALKKSDERFSLISEREAKRYFC